MVYEYNEIKHHIEHVSDGKLIMEETPQQEKEKSPRAKRRPAPKSDRLIWFERARAMHNYGEALKQADAKALKLFDLVADQMKRQISFTAVLYGVVISVSLLILVISLVFVFTATANPFLQTFSLVGVPVSILTLLVALMRNPVVQQRQLLDSTLKLNVVLLSFIRRVQQHDLLLEYLFYDSDPLELTKIYALIQEFQNITEQTMGEIKEINQG